MRIAYLCLQATREGQASHAHVHEIIAGLEEQGHAVELFEPRYAAESVTPPGPLGRLVEQWRVQRRLIAAGPFDLVYMRSHFAALPASRWAQRAGWPVVQEVNGPYEDLFLAWPAARWIRPIAIWSGRSQLRGAAAVVAVTPQLAEWARKEGVRSEISVIPNGANVDLFHPGLRPRRAAQLIRGLLRCTGAVAGDTRAAGGGGGACMA